MLEITKKQLSVLIIDDEPNVGDALAMVLRAFGYDVVLMSNGHDGIEEARTGRFDFTVVDMFLADISGLQVIAHIHQHQPELPILLVTGDGNLQLFAEARRLGAIGGLSKPFHAKDILQLIDASTSAQKVQVS